MYVLIPPVSVGAVKFTSTEVPLVANGVPIVGAAATVSGVIALLSPLASLVPYVLVAVTLNVYVVPLVNPVMLNGDDVPDPTMAVTTPFT